MKWLYLALAGAAVAAVAAWIAGSAYDWGWVSDLAPNVLTETLSILVTVAVVQRLIDRRRTADEGVRVKQALMRVSGALYVMADFMLWDYAAMHGNEVAYERPPAGLRDLLSHFMRGLRTRDLPLSDNPSFLKATKSLAERLDEDLRRHERVLDNGFIAAAYQYIRVERMARNMYNRPGSHLPGGTESARQEALANAVRAVIPFLDVFEPYARKYLDEDRWSVTLSEDEIATAAYYRTDVDEP